MKFSIILNTRGRPLLLENLLRSISNNTNDMEELEVLVCCDNDDIQTLDFIAFIFKNWNIDTDLFRFYFNDRNRNLNENLTFLAKRARGENILILNDDCEIVTKDWDKLVYNEIQAQVKQQKYHSYIYYCRTRCNSIDKNHNVPYCSFPIISKKSVEILGFFMSSDFTGLGADVHLYRIFEGVDLVFDVSLEIRHVLHETLDIVLNPDRTALEMRQNCGEAYRNCFIYPIDDEVKKIKEYISQ